MSMKNLTVSCVPCALYLSLSICFYVLIKLSGYTFVPFNGLVLSILTAGIITGFTVLGIITRNKKTRVTVAFSTLLPLISLLYIVAKLAASDMVVEGYGMPAPHETGNSKIIFIVHSSITLVSSMILFFSCGRGNVIKIGMGIVYSFSMLIVCSLFALWLFASAFGGNTLITSEMSPNSVYLAEVIDNDQGALGGATLVYVTRQNCDVNLLVGGLTKNPKKEIYYGRWGEALKMKLWWESDNILYINGVRYTIL